MRVRFTLGNNDRRDCTRLSDMRTWLQYNARARYRIKDEIVEDDEGKELILFTFDFDDSLDGSDFSFEFGIPRGRSRF